MKKAHAPCIMKPAANLAPKLALLWMDAFFKLVPSPFLIMVTAKAALQRGFTSVIFATHFALRCLNWVVQSSVIAYIKKLKIFKSVVLFVSVFMVNLLARTKLSSKMLFHNKSMFQHSHPALNQGPYIALCSDRFTIFERWVKLRIFSAHFPPASTTSLNGSIGVVGALVKQRATIGACNLVFWVGASAHRIELSLIHT